MAKKTYVVVYSRAPEHAETLTKEVKATSNIEAEGIILRDKNAYIFRSFLKGEE